MFQICGFRQILVENMHIFLKHQWTWRQHRRDSWLLITTLLTRCTAVINMASILMHFAGVMAECHYYKSSLFMPVCLKTSFSECVDGLTRLFPCGSVVDFYAFYFLSRVLQTGQFFLCSLFQNIGAYFFFQPCLYAWCFTPHSVQRPYSVGCDLSCAALSLNIQRTLIVTSPSADNHKSFKESSWWWSLWNCWL